MNTRDVVVDDEVVMKENNLGHNHIPPKSFKYQREKLIQKVTRVVTFWISR